MLPILDSAGAVPAIVAAATKAVSTPPPPPPPPPAPPPSQQGPSVAVTTTAAYQLVEAGDGALPPLQIEEAADSRADGPRAAGSMVGNDGEAAARQQPLPPPRPMTSPEEKVPAEVGPEQLAAMGDPGPSSSSLEPGTMVAGVGTLDA
ncbi:uncharacterized protein [Miscanthus floridulus]|uniref:uncharacterized protein n=1 Tax=Miscanthus floridulus TaxID=154761 RepID=UPI0034594371